MVLCWELILQSFNTTKIPHNFTGKITSKVVLLFKRFMISNYKKTKGGKRKQKKWNCLTDAAILLRIKDAEFMNMQYLFHFINDVRDNTLIIISVNVLLLACRLIFSSSPLARCSESDKLRNTNREKCRKTLKCTSNKNKPGRSKILLQQYNDHIHYALHAAMQSRIKQLSTNEQYCFSTH